MAAITRGNAQPEGLVSNLSATHRGWYPSGVSFPCRARVRRLLRSRAHCLHPSACPRVYALRAQERVLQTVPAYFWSGLPLFERGLVTDYTPSSTIWEAVDHLAGLKPESSLARSSDAKPEVVLSFTYDKLRSDLVQRSSEFAGFKAAFQRAASSLAVPYVVLDGSRSTPAHSVCCSTAESYLQSSGVLTNGVNDVVNVNVGAATEENDRMVSQIVEMVSKATNGRYVAMLTANSTVPSDMVLEFGQKEAASTRRRLAYAETQVRQIPITPGILTGLLVGGLLFVIFINGFCCLFALQTPKGFEHE